MADSSSLSGRGKLTCKQSLGGDHYVGSVEALIAAGIITIDQVPGHPGRNKISCTFYDDQPVKRGVPNTPRDERYLNVVRRGKSVQVFRGISKQVQSERRAEAKRQLVTNATGAAAGQTLETAHQKTPHDFREFCVRMARMAPGYTLDNDFDADIAKLYPFKFSADARAEMERVLCRLAALIWTSEVVPLHPGKLGKAHLRLAWSAA